MKVKNGKDYIVDVNPVDRVERPRKVRPVRKFLHREEISKVLSLEAPENEALARDLFFDTGLRVSEIANASVHDLRVTGDGTVILGASVKGRGRTLEKVDIPLGKHVGERLMAQLQEREAGPKDPIIVNREGRRYTRTTLSEMVMRMGKKAGIDRMNVRPHAIRHTYNVLARQAGVDVATRAKLLNHTDTNTLQRYDHVLPEETRAARDVVRQEVLRG
jgi:site-specific recombinase XerD